LKNTSHLEALVAGAIAAIALAASGDAPAQTTSARGESLEVSSRADELLADGEHKRAAQVYRRALEIDETNERAYVGLSAALDALGRHTEALDVLKTAASRLGWTADLGLQRGIHLSRLKRWDDAAAALDRVMRERPESFEAAHYLATAQLARSDWDAAVRAFDVYLDRRPDELAARDLSVRTRRAYALLSGGHAKRARKALDAVLTDTPDRITAQVLLFTALAKEGNCDRALAMFDALEELGSKAPSILYNAAVCRFRTGDARGALAALESYRESHEPPPQALLLDARIHVSLGDSERAERSYRDAIAAGLGAEAELAERLLERGEDAQVVALLWPLVEAASRDPAVLALAATALATESDYERAAVASARLVEVRADARSWSLHGDILLARGDWSGAETAYARAIQAAPRDKDAAVGLRRALERRATDAFRAGDRDQAYELLTRAVDADDTAHDAAYNLALLELDRNNPERAVALLDPRLDRVSSPDRARLALGHAYVRVGSRKAAARSLTAVADDKRASGPVRALAMLNLALTGSTSGSIRRARQLAAGDGRVLAFADGVKYQILLEASSVHFERGNVRLLAKALKRVSTDALDPRQRVRARVFALLAQADDKGVRYALKQLAAISADELASISSGKLEPEALRSAIALDIGARSMKRAAEYRALRSHAAALRPLSDGGSNAALDVLATFYSRVITWSAGAGGGLARSVANDAPASVLTPAFRHNAIIAAAGKRKGHRRFNRAQIQQLEALAADMPEAWLNLAIDADARGDDAAALEYFAKIPASARKKDVAEWIRWKELVHGAP
jgi:tetratricopeptide (TPR) repeat protein